MCQCGGICEWKRGTAIILPRSIRRFSRVEEKDKSTGGSLTERIIKYGREEGDQNFIPHFRPGKKFARFTQKFRRRVRPLFATVVFLGQRVCVPFALHIASLTARGILPTDLTVMTSAMRGSEAKSILNLHCQWNEGGRGSMLKENKI